MSSKRPEALPNSPGGVTRRTFLTTLGVGAATAAVTGQVVGAPSGREVPVAAGEMVSIELHVNGRRRRLQVEPRWTLLFVLRERLGITGTKEGCSRGECGACTVLIDGIPRYACLTLALEAEGHAVTTVEGLMDGEDLGPTQQAFLEKDGYQCGYCTSGQIMAAEGLLRRDPAPDLETIRRGMSGNLCRCGAYPSIFASVHRAGELKRGGGK